MFWIFIDVDALWCFLGTSRGTGRITRQAFEDPEGGLLVRTSENWWIEGIHRMVGDVPPPTGTQQQCKIRRFLGVQCPYQKK